MSVIGWIGAFLFFIIVEMGTMALTTIWFAGGALAGLILCLLGAGIEVQLAAFALVSFALLGLTRPLALRYVNRRVKKTNVDSLIGRTARITEEVDGEAQTGAAVLDGNVWTARSATGEKIPAGTLVKVQKIQGVKLIVEPVKEGEH
ncbi:MAG TPA: NfeD family protein [Candidatus Cottocaccamicrobium excrementipullorum]|nr:NfeD family protein [Candidatus Cottocaccamicrobium excrementipullorum]